MGDGEDEWEGRVRCGTKTVVAQSEMVAHYSFQISRLRFHCLRRECTVGPRQEHTSQPRFCQADITVPAVQVPAELLCGIATAVNTEASPPSLTRLVKTRVGLPNAAFHEVSTVGYFTQYPPPNWTCFAYPPLRPLSRTHHDSFQSYNSKMATKELSLRDKQIGVVVSVLAMHFRPSANAGLAASIKRILNLNHNVEAEEADDANADGSLRNTASAILSSDGEPIWKVLVFDDLGRDVISSVLRVSDLRSMGVTMHMSVFQFPNPLTWIGHAYDFYIGTSELRATPSLMSRSYILPSRRHRTYRP